MKRQKVTGRGGIQLQLVENGNSTGRPILFIPKTCKARSD
jgi:hypothetical protein